MTFNVPVLYELSSTNSNNTYTLLNTSNDISVWAYMYVGSVTKKGATLIPILNKNSSVYSNTQYIDCRSDYRGYFTIVIQSGFRPCFSIIDNDKSSNLFS